MEQMERIFGQPVTMSGKKPAVSKKPIVKIQNRLAARQSRPAETKPADSAHLLQTLKRQKQPRLERIMQVLFFAAAAASVLCLVLVCVFLLLEGAPALAKIGVFKFLFGSVWKPANGQYGMLPMLAGSVYVTVLALAIGVPIGICSALYLARFCPKKLYRPLKSAVDLMAGIPSVTYGFFGLTVIVPFIREHFNSSGMSVLAAGIVLAMMILPTIISVSETSIRNVDEGIYQGSLALGLSPERSAFKAVLPAAKGGILTAVILGMGRALGETMAVKMVVGNQPIFPDSILHGARTLTSGIVLEMGYAADLHRQALIALGLVLFLLILLVYGLLNLYKERKVHSA